MRSLSSVNIVFLTVVTSLKSVDFQKSTEDSKGNLIKTDWTCLLCEAWKRQSGESRFQARVDIKTIILKVVINLKPSPLF